MNEQEFQRLDKAVSRIVEAHNRAQRGPVPNLAPIRPWRQTTWIEGEISDQIIGIDDAPRNGHVGVYGSRARVLALDCGTSCCLAGDAVLDSGAQILVNEDEDEPGERVGFNTAFYEGQLWSVRALADHLFGLEEISHGLFDGSNDAEAIIEEATRLAAVYGFTLTAKVEDLL